MKGREVIKIEQTFTLDEFEKFMQDNWDSAQYGAFRRGKPTPASIEEYILLPATTHCLIAAYPRKGKVILTVVDSPEGVARMVFSALPTHGTYLKIAQSAASISRAKEFRGPAHEINQMYAEHMRNLLQAAGLCR